MYLSSLCRLAALRPSALGRSGASDGRCQLLRQQLPPSCPGERPVDNLDRPRSHDKQSTAAFDAVGRAKQHKCQPTTVHCLQRRSVAVLLGDRANFQPVSACFATFLLVWVINSWFSSFHSGMQMASVSILELSSLMLVRAVIARTVQISCF